MKTCHHIIAALSRYIYVLGLSIILFVPYRTGAQNETTEIAKLQSAAKDSVESNPNLSAGLAAKAYKLSLEKGEKRNAVISLNIQGSALHNAGKLEDAIAVLSKGLEIANTNKSFEDLRKNLLVNLGLVYENRGEYKTALKQYEAALAVSNKLKDTLSIGNCYHNMGVLSLHMNNNELARKYFLEAVSMYTAINDAVHIAGAYLAIGGVYFRDKKYREALAYMLQGQKMSDTIQSTKGDAVGNMNIALCYQELGKIDSAIAYYNKAEVSFDKLNTSTNKILLYINMGTVYDESAQYAKAIESYKLALKLANELHYPMGISFAYGNMAETYEKMGNYKDAIKYLQLHIQIKDTLLNKENMEALEEMEAKYKTKELDDRNNLLQKENDLQKLRLRNKDLLIYSGFGAALLILVIGIQVVRQNRLKAARQKLELEQKQLQAQMNPHFIFNCLNSIQQFVLQNDRANANKYLADFALLMRQTLDNSKDGTISLQREIEYLNNYLSFEHMRHEDKFSYNIQCDPSINPYTVEIPSMIIQPFVENAIKHGLCNREGNGGVLNIRFYTKDDALFCDVEDNGIGIKEATRLKEGNFITHKSRGLELTRQRLALASKTQSNDYTISIIDRSANGDSTGTIVTIKFPLYA